MKFESTKLKILSVFIVMYLLGCENSTNNKSSDTNKPTGVDPDATFLWDQQPDTSVDTTVNLEFSDMDSFSTYLVNDISVSEAITITTVTTYFTNRNNTWETGIQQARLSILPSDFEDSAIDPRTTSEVVMVSVAEIEPGVLAVKAANLNKRLAAGEHWIGLTPIISSSMDQESQYSTASRTRLKTAFINPGGGFGQGTNWIDVDDIEENFKDAAMTIETNSIIAPSDPRDPTGTFVWDQQPDVALDPIINFEFTDMESFSTYVVNDIDVPENVTVTAVTTYFTNDHDTWQTDVQQARLTVLAPEFESLGIDPRTVGDIVSVAVAEISPGVLAVSASNLNISLSAGEHWIGLTPILTSSMNQESQHSSSTRVRIKSAFINPGGGFGQGANWINVEDIVENFNDAAMTIETASPE